MKNSIKGKAGITLISLAITIIIMAILASVVTYTGIETIQNTQMTRLISELEIVQANVNNIYQKRKLNKEDLDYYNSIGKDISLANTKDLSVALPETDLNSFKYFDKEELKKLDIDISQEVLINYDTREVISLRGIQIDNVKYYRLIDIPNYDIQNINYVDKNIYAPTFDIELTKLSDSWEVRLKNIEYKSNATIGTVSYKLHKETNWNILGQTTSFKIATPRIL